MALAYEPTSVMTPPPPKKKLTDFLPLLQQMAGAFPTAQENWTGLQAEVAGRDPAVLAAIQQVAETMRRQTAPPAPLPAPGPNVLDTGIYPGDGRPPQPPLPQSPPSFEQIARNVLGPEPLPPDWQQIAGQVRQTLPVTDMGPPLQALQEQYQQALTPPPLKIDPFVAALLALAAPKGSGLRALSAIGQGFRQGQEPLRQAKLAEAAFIPQQVQDVLQQRRTEEARQDQAVQAGVLQAQNGYERALQHRESLFASLYNAYQAAAAKGDVAKAAMIKADAIRHKPITPLDWSKRTLSQEAASYDADAERYRIQGYADLEALARSHADSLRQQIASDPTVPDLSLREQSTQAGTKFKEAGTDYYSTMAAVAKTTMDRNKATVDKIYADMDAQEKRLADMEKRTQIAAGQLAETRKRTQIAEGALGVARGHLALAQTAQERQKQAQDVKDLQGALNQGLRDMATLNQTESSYQKMKADQFLSRNPLGGVTAFPSKDQAALDALIQKVQQARTRKQAQLNQIGKLLKKKGKLTLPPVAGPFESAPGTPGGTGDLLSNPGGD